LKIEKANDKAKSNAEKFSFTSKNKHLSQKKKKTRELENWHQ